MYEIFNECAKSLRARSFHTIYLYKQEQLLKHMRLFIIRVFPSFFHEIVTRGQFVEASLAS